MDEQGDQIGDEDLRARILDGLGAFAELQSRFRKGLEEYLVARCSGGDGRSREQAVEIASQVLTDCFARSPSLLERWRGGENLEAFLRTVALNRLKSWWVSRDAAVEVDSGSRSITGAAVESGEPFLDRAEMRCLQDALAEGVAAALSVNPEGVLFMRLKGLHGVDQRAISAAWGHHESQTSRKIKDAMELIRSTAIDMATKSGCRPELDGLKRALQADPSILLGSGSTAVDPNESTLLQNLAKGSLQPAARERAVDLMCRNAQAMSHFANLLQSDESGWGKASLIDSALDGVGGRIDSCIRRHLDVLTPSGLRERVSPLMFGVFGDALRFIGAEGGSLWWIDPSDSALEAVFNPFEPEFSGYRQPLVSGIISLVIATSENVRVGTAACHPAHSPAIDSLTGKATRSMIAIPFQILDQTYGVLTAVRLENPAPFSVMDEQIIERQSDLLANLLTFAFTTEILGRGT